jgi:Tol biopolymer transport system component
VPLQPLTPRLPSHHAIRAAATLAALGVGLLGGCSERPAEPLPETREPRVVFITNRDGNAELYVVNADGTGLTRLTSYSATDTWTVRSPDGRKIASQANRDRSANDVYVMSTHGSGVTRLTTDAAVDQMPTWSTDGARIGLMSALEGNPDVIGMNAGSAPSCGA